MRPSASRPPSRNSPPRPTAPGPAPSPTAIWCSATYDTHENGVTEDNIDGGIIVNGEWFNIAHCLPPLAPRRHGLDARELAPSRENHILPILGRRRFRALRPRPIDLLHLRCTAGDHRLLRLAFVPERIDANEERLKQRTDLRASGYTVKHFPMETRLYACVTMAPSLLVSRALTRNR